MSVTRVHMTHPAKVRDALDFDYSVVREQRSDISVIPKLLGAGGAERVRTVDLRLAKPALSQLSYSPGDATPLARGMRLTRVRTAYLRNKVGQGRLELPTSRLSGVRSNHLSYWPGSRARHSMTSTRPATEPLARSLETGLYADQPWITRA